MPISWKNIRIPLELHARLVRLAEAFDRSLENCDPPQFTPKVPWEFLDRGGTPLWFVVEKAVKELEAHRRRSKYKRKQR
jgi:hypothetical protein